MAGTTSTVSTAQAGRLAPGPQGKPLLGSLPAMRRKGMLPFYQDLWREYGDIVRIKMGPLFQFLITQPDHIYHVLVSNKDNYCKGLGYRKLKLALGNGLLISEGELWQRQRRLMQPPFTARGISQFGAEMVAATEAMLARWHPAARQGEVLDINEEMMRLAMSIIGRTMFGIDVGEEALEAGQAFTYVLNFTANQTVTLFDVPLFIPTPANRRFKQSMRLLRTFMTEIIERRRREPDGKEDLLSILLKAQDEETGDCMSQQQLYDEVLTIFFAGHETTAQALTWTWYLLSQHPEVEAKLQFELAQVLAGRSPTVNDLPHLPYTRMVIQEALRLYPPIWIFVRDAVGQDEIGGYSIPRRAMIVMSQYITHRHPALWEAPDQFDPERFLPERAEGRSHYAYFPFGAGRRTCIGDKFAMQEAQLVLATVAQHYSLRLVPGQQVEPSAVGTLRPAHGLPMTLQPR